MEDIEELQQNLEKLKKENISLKNEIKLLKEKENSYQSSISRIKKIQNEYESSYNESLNDYKKHEEELKKKYLEYQKILENQNQENEKRLSDEIFLLKSELKEKDNIINALKEKINTLNEKITKDELTYYFKEKEYEDIIISKERKLSELNEAIKQIVQEATEEIKRLSEQLEDFQNRTRLANPMNFLIEKETLENNYNLQNINNLNNLGNLNALNNLNNLNRSVDNVKQNNLNSIKSLKQNDIIKQSQNIINNSVLLSDNFKKVIKDGNTPQRINNSFMLNNKNNNLANDNPLFYTQNNFYNKNNPDLMTQLYILQNDKNLLVNQLQQKEKEVNFWKNLRSDLYANAQNNLRGNNSNKYINDIKLQNMEKTLINYGNKINRINKQYNESLKNHQREIDKLKNEMENSINLTQNSKIMNEGTFNMNSYEEVDMDENEQASEDLLHALKISIPSKEGIRNEYINSQVQKIKNSENVDNKE